MRCTLVLVTFYAAVFTSYTEGFAQTKRVAHRSSSSPTHLVRRAQGGNPRQHVCGMKRRPAPTNAIPMMARSPDPELEGIKLDPSTLDPSERERLEGVRAIQSKMAEVQAKTTELRGTDAEGLSEEDRLWREEGAAYIDKCLDEVTAIQRQFGMRVSEETEQEEREVMDTAWRGQAGLDVTSRGQKNWADLATRKWLAAGDIAVLTLFAWGGRASHGMGDLDFSVLVTAFPFYVGWLSVAPFLGAHTPAATASLGDAAKILLPAWGLSIPAAIALRSLLLKGGEVPPLGFTVAAMIFTFVALLSWRGLYTVVNPTPEGDKEASVLDVFRMITTLVQRW